MSPRPPPPSRMRALSSGPRATHRARARSLRCSRCDFKVLLFADSEWSESVDYMFFRNHMPDRTKLGTRARPKDGVSAYACQCSWCSVDAWSAKLPHDHWFGAAR